MLVSGSGTNLAALIEAATTPDFGAEIVLVLSDRAGVRALERAEAAGIPTVVVPWEGDRDTFTTAVCDRVEESGAAAMVLAGFMRILGQEAIRRFPLRIVNIHPSLLPSFPGAHGVEDALEYGVAVTGVTIHFVDEQVDHGPIIAQEAVPVLADDTAETLHARVQQVEHRLFPEVVKAFAAGRLQCSGRRVIWS